MEAFLSSFSSRLGGGPYSKPLRSNVIYPTSAHKILFCYIGDCQLLPGLWPLPYGQWPESPSQSLPTCLSFVIASSWGLLGIPLCTLPGLCSLPPWTVPSMRVPAESYSCIQMAERRRLFNKFLVTEWWNGNPQLSR